MTASSSDSAGSAASDIFQAYENRLSKVGPSAVLIQLALMTAAGAVAILLFVILRPRNSIVYQPKIKYSVPDKRPPEIGKGYFSWLRPVLTGQEQEIMKCSGLDAVAFLRFLRMCRNALLCIAILSLLVLLPIDVAYTVRHVDAAKINFLQAMTITNVRGSWLWAHVAMTYAATLIMFYFIYINYGTMVKLRWQWFFSDEYRNSLHARSLLLTGVPKTHRTDAGLDQLMGALQIPYPTTAVHISRRMGDLPRLIEQHKKCVKELEAVLTKYLKSPTHLPSSRPMMKVKEGLVRKSHQDAINYLANQVKSLEAHITSIQGNIDLKKAESYGFASFENAPYAHATAKMLEGQRTKGAKFQLAPPPKDIIWQNLGLSDYERTRNKIVGGFLLVGLCVLYSIPLVAVSLLANLAALTAYVSFIQTWYTDYSFLFAAFVGIVPPLLSVLLQIILPNIMRKIARYQGCTTKSQADRWVTGRYSAFLLIVQLFVFSLLGVTVQIISKVVLEIQGNKSTKAILEYLGTIPDQLQSTWVSQSSYWLTIFPLRGATCLFDLAQVISLIWTWLRTKLFGRTPREIREWTKPPKFDYAVYYSNHVFLIAVAVIYAPLAALVPLFGACAFAISNYVYKYQLLYVATCRVESGGRLWNVAINRVMVTLVMMQALVALTIGLQIGWLYAISLSPLPISVLAFKIYLNRTFNDMFRWFIPGEEEIKELFKVEKISTPDLSLSPTLSTTMHMLPDDKYATNAVVTPDKLVRRYGHPALTEPLFVPMLHKHAENLISEVFAGPVQATRRHLDGSGALVDAVIVSNGLTFEFIDRENLFYSPKHYLKERMDYIENPGDHHTLVGSDTATLIGSLGRSIKTNLKGLNFSRSSSRLNVDRYPPVPPLSLYQSSGLAKEDSFTDLADGDLQTAKQSQFMTSSDHLLANSTYPPTAYPPSYLSHDGDAFSYYDDPYAASNNLHSVVDVPSFRREESNSTIGSSSSYGGRQTPLLPLTRSASPGIAEHEQLPLPRSYSSDLYEQEELHGYRSVGSRTRQ